MVDDRSDAELAQLARAYERRSEQLYEARGALAEVVATVTAELNRCRDDRDRALADVRGLREHTAALGGEIEKLQGECEKLRRQVADLSARTQAAESILAACERIPVLSWVVRSTRIARRLKHSAR